MVETSHFPFTHTSFHLGQPMVTCWTKGLTPGTSGTNHPNLYLKKKYCNCTLAKSGLFHDPASRPRNASSWNCWGDLPTHRFSLPTAKELKTSLPRQLKPGRGMGKNQPIFPWHHGLASLGNLGLGRPWCDVGCPTKFPGLPGPRGPRREPHQIGDSCSTLVLESQNHKFWMYKHVQILYAPAN